MRAIWSLIAVDMLARVSYQICRTPVLPLYVAALGGGPAIVGLTGAASTITGIALKAPAGALSDTLGRRPLLLGGLAVFALGPFLYFVDDAAWLLPIRLFHGVATAVFGPVAAAAIADMARGRRGEYLSWLSNSRTCAGLLGSLAGGLILSSAALDVGRRSGAPIVPGLGSFHVAWWIAGAFGMAALCLGPMVMQRVREPEHRTASGAFAKLTKGLAEVAGHRRVLLVSGCEGVQNLTVGMVEQFLPLYAVIVAGRSPLEAGLIFGVQTVTTIASKPLLGRWSDVRGRKGLVVAGMLLCALPFAAIPWASGLVPLLGLALVFGLGEALVTAASSALVADLCRQESLGAAMGVFGTIGDIGHAAGPVLGGLLIAGTAGAGQAAEAIREAGPFRVAFGVMAAVLLAFSAVFLLLDRPRAAAA
ncbi:MAG TPA: MFS transporter [Planctomycetota bacterium]|nr:MFS transporter [Planctomycetota bacterium]